MFCRSCGKENKEGNKFCNQCGKILSIENSDKDLQEISIKKFENIFKSSLILKIIIGIVFIIVLYIIFSDKPFSFWTVNNLEDSTDQNTIDQHISQDIITSSVVNVLCESITDENEISGGSGTIIGTEGIIITNSHVIPQNETNILTPDEGCLIILPNDQTGQPEEIYWAVPIVIPELSDNYDLAYLQIYDIFVDEDGQEYGSLSKVFPSIFAEEEKYDDICQFQEIKLGDPIKVFGYPETSGGMDLTITDGVVSSLPGDGTILTSAKIDAGNSGGLAVDKKGCMVGIPVAISEGKYQNLGVIISTDLIVEFSEKYYNLINQ